MKKKIYKLIALWLSLGLTIFIGGFMETDLIVQMLGGLWGALLGKYGILVQIVSVIGTARLIFKNVFELVVKPIVKATPSPKDDEAVSKFENNKIYKSIFYFLDLFLSIKPKSKL